MRKKIVILVAAIAALVMIGCGGASEKEFIGKYKMEMDTSKVAADKKAQMDMAKSLLSSMEMELMADNKGKMSAMGQTKEGTWKLAGGKLLYTDKDGAETTMKIDGKNLIMDMPEAQRKEMEGVTMKWIKQ